MKKCLLTFVIIYLIYIWIPPFLTMIFPVNEKKVEGNYILSSCHIDECSFYNIHFNENQNLIIQCIDKLGNIKNTSVSKWKVKNGHTIEIEGDFDNFSFPYFGDIHRNLFFPWIIKIEAAIDGKCELEQWNFANKL